MISIARYLNFHDYAAKNGDSAIPEGLFLLCIGLCRNFSEQLLHTSRAGLRTRLESIESAIAPDISPADAAALLDSHAKILKEHAANLEQSSRRYAADMQDIVVMFNEALIELSGGSERAVSRLKTIQTSLERSTAMQDLAAVKGSLADTLYFVRQEASREQQRAVETLHIFEAKVSKAQQMALLVQGPLPGRADALEALARLDAEPPDHRRTYLAAFRFDRMAAIVQRYGASAAEEVLSAIYSQRIRKFAEDASVYSWSPSTLVALFRTTDDPAIVSRAAAEANQHALIHRTSVGSRAPTLTVRPSLLVCEVQRGNSAARVSEIDGFADGGKE